jgi:hypothetical protein
MTELDLGSPRRVRLAAYSTRGSRFKLPLRFLNPHNDAFTSSLDFSVPGE